MSEMVSSVGATQSGLELRVGRLHLAVPVERVERVADLAVNPLPLAAELIAGVAFAGERPVLCVSLRQLPTSAAEVHKLVLLRADGPVGWALCVDRVMSLVEVVDIERGEVTGEALPAWVSRGRTGGGRVLGWLDVGAMVHALHASRAHGGGA